MKKPLVVFFLIVSVLGILALVKHRHQQAREKQDTSTQAAQTFKPVFDPQTVTELTLKSPTETLEFKKDKGVWQVVNLYGGMNADAGTVMNFLTSLHAVRGEERSTDKSLLRDFGLLEEESIQFIVKGEGKTLEHILLGKKATGKRSNFLRRANTNTVFVVPDDILSFLGFKPDAPEAKMDQSMWLDKQVLSFNADEVRALEIARAGNTVAELTKPDNGSWQFTQKYPFTPDSEKVTNYLKMLSNLRAFEIVARDAVSFGDNDWTLTLSFQDKEPIKLQRKYKDDGTFYLSVAGKELLYKIAVYHFENLEKSDGGFFASNIFGLDTAKVTSLKLNDTLGRKKYDLARYEEKPRKEGESARITWKSSKGTEAFDNERITRILDNLKNIYLKTKLLATSIKTDELLAITFTADNVSHELRVRNNPSKDPENACFPVMFDKDRNVYCLEEGFVRGLTGAVAELSK